MESKDNPSKPFVFPVMKKTIEDLFTKSKITKNDIEAFQDKYWEQLVPNFSQALKLLDIHGVPRHNILWSINDRLMDAIKARVDSKPDDCDQKKCQKLWQKLIKTGIVYIHHPYMRSLIMQVLGKMNSIKERHVNLIVDNKYLYDDAPLPVLRHIWVAHPHKFQEELDKVIATFQSTWSSAILDALSMSIMSTASTTADLVPILYWPPRRRRRDPSIVRIVEMIGEGQVLYDKTISILRDQCIKCEKAAYSLMEQQIKSTIGNNNPSEEIDEQPPPAKRSRQRFSSKEKSSDIIQPSASQPIPYIPLAFMPNQPSVASATLCTLRFDLLMSLNEAKIDRLCVPDRIHRFVWCLDACVRNRRIDQRHASELAYHLQLQRRRWAKETADECHESYESNGNISGEMFKRGHSSSSSRGKNSKSGKTNRKQSPTSAEKHCNSEDLEKIADVNLLEKDMHMACRDPWVVYTICTSLIRYVLSGLYEDKLPRDIPEVHLLVHLLVLGLGDDLIPYSCLQSKTKENSISKRNSTTTTVTSSTPSSSSLSSDIDDPTLSCPSKALISHILPAVAQLQVLTWRAQVAEEILTLSNSLWPTNSLENTTSSSNSSSGGGGAGGGSTPSNNNNTNQRSTSHESKESLNPSSLSSSPSSSLTTSPPLVWQKRIKDATQCVNITVPSGYLTHPIGYLILQYHCLFCLERNELATLRALLKLAVTLAQSRVNRSNPHHHHNKSTIQSQPITPTKLYCTDSLISNNKFGLSVIFRWRPEVLQALVLGISRLPQSAPAFVDIDRNTHITEGSVESSLNDNTGQSDSDNNSSNISSLVRTNSMMSNIIPNNELGNNSIGFTNVLNPTCQNTNPESYSTITGSIVTRANLAGLLRSSLPLINDVQLLALAQVALLVPGPTNTNLGTSGMSNSGGTNVSSIHPLSSGTTTSTTATTTTTDVSSINESVSSAPSLSERERLVNTLARHCNITSVGSTSTLPTTDLNLLFESSTQQSGTTAGSTGSYKSSNPRVLAALDVLRKDIEKSHNSLASPLTPTNLVGIKTGPGGYSSSASSLNASANLLTNFTGFQMPDAWVAPSPRSPLSSNKYSRFGADSLQSSNNTSTSLTSTSLSSCYSSSSTSSYGLHLPIGTPLTNPGLMGATPHLSNLHIGQGQMPSLRKLPTLTPSPEILSSLSSSSREFRTPLSPNPIHHQRNKFGTDTLYASCPSPAVHRPGASHDNSNIVIPRSPSPPPPS
uniref:Negative elongation factor B n=1 Tax=Schistosoma mansoni TaxID=6183 RepID=A0A5K4FE84_SCHMA